MGAIESEVFFVDNHHSCPPTVYRSLWDLLCNQLFAHRPSDLDPEESFPGVKIWHEGVISMTKSTEPYTFTLETDAEEGPRPSDIIFYKKKFYIIKAVEQSGDVYTCTGCVRIEESIVGSYAALLELNTLLNNAESERTEAEEERSSAEEARVQQANTDHERAGDDHDNVTDAIESANAAAQRADEAREKLNSMGAVMMNDGNPYSSSALAETEAATSQYAGNTKISILIYQFSGPETGLITQSIYASRTGYYCAQLLLLADKTYKRIIELGGIDPNTGYFNVTTVGAWSEKNYYSIPSTGIPASDIAEGVIPDVSQFVTKSVNDLANYYLKSETYTKEEVLALIAGIGQFVYVVADILPSASADTMGKIYLVPSSDPQVQNTKDEFITIDNNGVYSWEQIGSTTIDLSGYVTTQELNTALANYTTSAELTTLLAAKYEKPSAGIPKSDLASSVQSSINKADTAYQKPSTGIPDTDMTAGVRGSLELANSSATLNEYTIYEEQGLLLGVSGNSYLVRIGDGDTDAVYLISCEDDYTNTRVNELTSYVDLDIGFYLCSPGKLLFWASSTTKFSIISLRENGAIDAEIIDEIPVDAEGISPERYATDSELALKQNLISDLPTIRSGAAAGASAVQPSAIAHMESTDNKTTSLSSASTDQQYPSAKAVYDFVMDTLGDIETLLAAI